MFYDVCLFGCSGFLANHFINHFVNENKKILAIGPYKPEITNKNIHYVKFDLLEDIPIPFSKSYTVKTFIFNSVKKGRFKKKSNDWLIQGKISAPNFTKLFKVLNLEVERLITMGSSEEYGPIENSESISEDYQCKPITSYGYWKSKLLEEAKQWAYENNKSFVHLRPFIIFGPGQDENMFLHSIITTLLQDKNFKMTKGEQYRNFIHIYKVVEFIIKLIFKKKWQYNIINIGSDVYLKLSDVAQTIFNIIKKGKLDIGAIPYRNFEVWHQKPDLTRMNREISGIKHNPFEFDIKRLIEFYKR